MFERVLRRGEAKAARRARELAGLVAAEVPDGVAAEVVEGGVVLSGRGLRVRMATEGVLRSLVGRMR